MDPPHDKTPAKMEQRNGRILRQGNIHGIPKEELEAADRAAADRGGVDVVMWGVQRSMDAAIYQLLQNKAGFIKAAMTTGNFDQDALDEVSLSMAQMTALALGDPDLIRKVELEEQRGKLKTKKGGWERDVAVLKKRIRDARNTAVHAQTKIDTLSIFDYEALSADHEQAATFEALDATGAATTIHRQDYKGPDKKTVKATPVKDLDAWLASQMDWRRDKSRRVIRSGGVEFAITVSEMQGRPTGVVMLPGTGVEAPYNGGAGLALQMGKLLKTTLPGQLAEARETLTRSESMAKQASAKSEERTRAGWPGQADLDSIQEELVEIAERLAARADANDVSVDVENLDHVDLAGPDVLRASDRSGTGFIMRTKSGKPYATQQAAKAARTKAERAGVLASGSQIMETEGGFEIWGAPVDDSDVSAIEDLLTPPKEWRGLPDGHPLLTQTANEDGSLNKQTAVLPESNPLVKRGLLPAGEHARGVVHDAIIAYFVSGKKRQVKREILFMAGGGAAGKSTYLRENPGKVPPEAVEVNADDIKALLPEFEEIIAAKDTRAALMVHEESSMLAKRVASEALAEGLNVVYDATLAQPSKAVPLMQRFAKAGYKTRVVGLTVDPMLALQRSYTRFLEKGRWVPPDVLLGAHAEYNANVERYATVADDYEVYESSHGSLRLILNQKNGKLRSKNEPALQKAGTYALLDPKGSILEEVFAEIPRSDGGARQRKRRGSKGAPGAEVRLSGDLSRERYVSDALANLNRISRTAGGTIDASASPGKAEVFAGNADPAAQANENFTKLIGRLYDERAREFANPGEVLAFVDSINRDVNKGIVKEGVLLRTEDSPKYPYTRIKHIGAARKQFAAELLEKMDSMDPVELAAWIHWRVNMTDHVYADGVGKTAEALADWALMRRGLPLPTMPDRKAWFKIAFRASPPDPKFPATYNVGYTRFRRAFRGMFPKTTPVDSVSTDVETAAPSETEPSPFQGLPQREFLDVLHPSALSEAGFPELADNAARAVAAIGDANEEESAVTKVREDALRAIAVDVATAAINAEIPATRDRLLGILRAHPMVRVDERTTEATRFNADLHFSEGGIPAGAPIQVVQPGYALTLSRLPGQLARNRRPKSVMDGMRKNPDGTYNIPLVKARVERETSFPAATPVPQTTRKYREARAARSKADQELAARLMREGGIVTRPRRKETIRMKAGVVKSARDGERRNMETGAEDIPATLTDTDPITKTVIVDGWVGSVPDDLAPAQIPGWVQSGKTPAVRQKRYQAAIGALARGWMGAEGATQAEFAQALGELGARRAKGGYVNFDPERHVGRDGQIPTGRKVRMFVKGWVAPVWHDLEAASWVAPVTKSVVTRAIEQGGEDGGVLRAAEQGFSSWERTLDGDEAVGNSDLQRMAGSTRDATAGAVFAMLEFSYRDLGVPSESADALLQEPTLFDVVFHQGKPVAFCIQKLIPSGYKTVALGSDGSPEGKVAARSFINRLDQPGYWAELSDVPLILAKKAGIPEIPAIHAASLTGKNVTIVGEFAFSRYITGLPTPHVKTIVGRPWTLQSQASNPPEKTSPSFASDWKQQQTQPSVPRSGRTSSQSPSSGLTQTASLSTEVLRAPERGVSERFPEISRQGGEDGGVLRAAEQGGGWWNPFGRKRTADEILAPDTPTEIDAATEKPVEEAPGRRILRGETNGPISVAENAGADRDVQLAALAERYGKPDDEAVPVAGQAHVAKGEEHFVWRIGNRAVKAARFKEGGVKAKDVADYLTQLARRNELLQRICFFNPAASASPSARGWRGFRGMRCVASICVIIGPGDDKASPSGGMRCVASICVIIGPGDDKASPSGFAPFHFRISAQEAITFALPWVGLAGFPATVASAGTSRVTTLQAPMMARSPMVTPGRTKARAPMKAWAPMVILRVNRGSSGLPNSWVPVHKYASCATVAPSRISIGPKL